MTRQFGIPLLSGIFAMGVPAGYQGAQLSPTHIIDLVTAVEPIPAVQDRIPEARQITPQTFGRQGRPDHEPELKHPFSLHVIALDRSSYAIGDPFIYELLLSNKGSGPVAFPTSTQPSKFSREMSRAVAASITLLFDDPQLGHQVVGGRVLYGAPSVPGSMIEVRAGETVAIRARGTWFLRSGLGKPTFDNWSKELNVKASVHISSMEVAYPPLGSDNGVAIHLRSQ